MIRRFWTRWQPAQESRSNWAEDHLRRSGSASPSAGGTSGPVRSCPACYNRWHPCLRGMTTRSTPYLRWPGLRTAGPRRCVVVATITMCRWVAPYISRTGTISCWRVEPQWPACWSWIVDGRRCCKPSATNSNAVPSIAKHPELAACLRYLGGIFYRLLVLPSGQCTCSEKGGRPCRTAAPSAGLSPVTRAHRAA